MSQVIEVIVGRVRESISDVVSAFTDAISRAITAIIDLIRSIASGLIDFAFATLYPLVSSLLDQTVRSVTEIIDNVVRSVRSTLGEVVGYVSRETSTILEEVYRIAFPYIRAGESKLMSASLKSMMTYVALKELEDIVRSPLRVGIGKALTLPVKLVLYSIVAQIVYEILISVLAQRYELKPPEPRPPPGVQAPPVHVIPMPTPYLVRYPEVSLQSDLTAVYTIRAPAEHEMDVASDIVFEYSIVPPTLIDLRSDLQVLYILPGVFNLASDLEVSYTMPGVHDLQSNLETLYKYVVISARGSVTGGLSDTASVTTVAPANVIASDSLSGSVSGQAVVGALVSASDTLGAGVSGSAGIRTGALGTITGGLHDTAIVEAIPPAQVSASDGLSASISGSATYTVTMTASGSVTGGLSDSATVQIIPPASVTVSDSLSATVSGSATAT